MAGCSKIFLSQHISQRFKLTGCRAQAAARWAVASSKRSSTVSATSRCGPRGAAMAIPASSANRRTRSGSRPGARNHGAMTTRRAPRRRNPLAASASDGSCRVANAVVTAAQCVPMASCGATAAVRALAAASDEPTATTSTPSVSSSRETPTRSVAHPAQKPDGRLRRAFRPVAHGDWRRTARSGRGYRRGHGRRPPAAGESRPPRRNTRRARRSGSVCGSRRTRPARRGGPYTPHPRGDRLRVGRRPWVRTSVRGQHQRSHEACSPHSVLFSPCQRPLRASAPSTGLVVQGAQPIDG